MAQYLYPSGTSYDANSFLPTFVGAPVFEQVVPASRNDATFIYDSANNDSGTYLTFSVPYNGAITPGPLANAGITVYFAHAQADADTAPYAPSSGGSATVISVELLKITNGGVTTLATSGDITTNEGSFALSSFTYTGSIFNSQNFDADWRDLYIRFRFVSGGGGSPSARRSIAISYASVEVPDPTPNGYAYGPAEPLVVQHLPVHYAPNLIPEIKNLSVHEFLLDGQSKSFSHPVTSTSGTHVKAIHLVFFTYAPYANPSPNDDVSLISNTRYNYENTASISNVFRMTNAWAWSGLSGRTEYWHVPSIFTANVVGNNWVTFDTVNYGGDKRGVLVIFTIDRPVTGTVSVPTNILTIYEASVNSISYTPTTTAGWHTFGILAGMTARGKKYVEGSPGSYPILKYKDYFPPHDDTPYTTNLYDTAFVVVGDNSLVGSSTPVSMRFTDSGTTDWHGVAITVAYAQVSTSVNATATGSLNTGLHIQDYVTGFSTGTASTSGSVEVVTLFYITGSAEAFGQLLAPDAIISQTNLSGSVAFIQERPDNSDGLWLIVS